MRANVDIETQPQILKICSMPKALITGLVFVALLCVAAATKFDVSTNTKLGIQKVASLDINNDDALACLVIAGVVALLAVYLFCRLGK